MSNKSGRKRENYVDIDEEIKIWYLQRFHDEWIIEITSLLITTNNKYIIVIFLKDEHDQHLPY